MNLNQFWAFSVQIEHDAEITDARIPQYNSVDQLADEDSQWQDTTANNFGRNWIRSGLDPNSDQPIQVKLMMLREQNIQLATPMPKQDGLWHDVEHVAAVIDNYLNPKAAHPPAHPHPVG